MSFNYKDVIHKILVCPKDGRTKSAIDFWKKETVLFKKLFKKFPEENFWSTLHLYDTPCKDGKLPSLALFLDKKNTLWSRILYKKWKTFHWSPPKYKSYKFKKDLLEPTNYKINKKTLRNFLRKK